MSDILVIGIAGGSGSGKTTITEQLVARLGSDVTVIAHDNYYRAHDDMTYEERALLNYDHPDAYETELFIEHLAALRRGETVQIPTYDFTVHNRAGKTITVKPSSVMIVEGIVILAHAGLRALMDLKVFVDCDADVRIIRRITRDMQERGRSLESIQGQYLATVKPMHEAFVEPSKRYADVVIPTLERNPRALDILVDHIEASRARLG